jgi:selenocysteine lyase/cysteine desulfurase
MKNTNFFNDHLMEEIRNRFAYIESDPLSGKRIFFENAGGTLKLKSIFEALEFYTALPDNAGRINAASKKVDEVIAQGRRDIALFLGAESGKIIAEQSVN